MMTMKLSNRARALKPSPTLSISKKAKQLKAQGVDVVDFGVGEPDFPTPAYIKDAAKQAIDANFTKYTETAGILPLREAICRKLEKENGLVYSPENILVSPGAKASLLQSIMTICDPRDEVLIPSPYWVSYTAQVSIADAIPVFLPATAESEFKITAGQLDQALTECSNPKALILNSPCNPTGSVYTGAELEKIAEVCVKHNIWVISDEIYEKLIYDGEKHVSIATFGREIMDRTILINGVSKAYSMTGWRLGYTAAPAEMVRFMTRIQDHASSNVNSITQKAAIAALTQDDGSIEGMRLEFEKRRTHLVERLNAIPNVRCNLPKGAFYAMPDVSYYLSGNRMRICNTTDLSEYLLDKFHVALVPGDAFGVSGLIRFSYANSLAQIDEGLNRFAAGLKSLLD